MSQVKSAIIVGGSLAGMMTALALSQKGISSIILERAARKDRRGAVLSVHAGGRDQLSLAHFLRAVAAGDGRGIESWRMIHQRLQHAVEQDPNIQIKYNVRVKRVSQNGISATAITDNKKYTADLLVGADGGNSQVRKYVNPEQPTAKFAGYQLWVGIVEEERLPENLWLDENTSDFMQYDGEKGDFLFALVTPGMDGSRQRGHRQLGIAWYDNGRNEYLYHSGAVKNNQVIHSLNGASFPNELKSELRKEANQYFPASYAKAVEIALENNFMVGTPVSEYVATKISRGLITLVGDAAHALTPMTANGFNTSLDDAAILAELTDKYSTGSEIMAEFEKKRLPIIRMVVQAGQSFSRSYAL
ncbi:NAD(P)/FAD-dependent oxidoreductase [Ligilactobacillus murinus]|uniref:NAD(P)/FAD-dependent oxidoreductase n=1 Tax=Ligilactobacillus murinus TaxID=1622 RepID=UPI00296B05D1|nr:NAD(P)/FAD-dependent oxidoreductase [Ligilactobacillus murinus]WOY89531.1 NAD(P)/FAD-dependent oxidoreductase [Ligilactobacillus murinus]